MDEKKNVAAEIGNDIVKLAVEAFAVQRNATLSTLFRCKRTLQGIVDNAGENPANKR